MHSIASNVDDDDSGLNPGDQIAAQRFGRALLRNAGGVLRGRYSIMILMRPPAQAMISQWDKSSVDRDDVVKETYLKRELNKPDVGG